MKDMLRELPPRTSDSIQNPVEVGDMPGVGPDAGNPSEQQGLMRQMLEGRSEALSYLDEAESNEGNGSETAGPEGVEESAVPPKALGGGSEGGGTLPPPEGPAAEGEGEEPEEVPNGIAFEVPVLPTREEMLMANEAEEPEVFGDATRTVVALPFGTLDGSVDPDQRRAVVEMITVPEAIEGKGTATRLLHTFARECQERSVERVDSVIVTPGALVVHAKVFGEDGLTYEEYPRGLVEHDAPDELTLEGGVELLTKIEGIVREYDERDEELPEDFTAALRVSIDLTRPEVKEALRRNPEYNQVSPEAMLAENAAATPRVHETNEGEPGLEITLPHGHAEVGLHGAEATLEYYQVPEAIRGNDVGTRLVAATGMACLHRNVEILYGELRSSAAIATQAKVFGKDNLVFYHGERGEPHVPVPLTYEQAMMSSQRAQEAFDARRAEHGLDVAFGVDVFTPFSVDLTNPAVREAVEQAADRYNAQA